MHFKREWGIRLALLILSPAAFFALLDVALRAAGVGFPAAFLVPAFGGHMFAPNPRFGELFFPKRMARVPAPHLLEDPKRQGTFRIFVLGESAAMGVPEPELSFGRTLEILLHERYPGMRFEVVNAAMTAINSHAILRIARDCARHSPDLFVVYMGNNEVVGPYGPGTVFTPAMSWLPLIRFNIWQRSTRSGQWIGSLLTRAQARPEWRGMEMFQDRLAPLDDPRLAGMYRNFQRNLEDIVAIGRRAGVPALLSTVAVNLKDCPPFAGAAAADEFRKGHWARARDLDELRFRADSRINAIIREVAARSGAILGDAERAFGPVPGSDLFYEHVHLRFRGNYLLARTVAGRIQVREQAAGDFPDEERVARLLPYTPWDEYRMASQMHALMERPPFTKQLGYRTAREQRLRLLKAPVNAAEALGDYAVVMKLRPDDAHVQLRYAELLRQAGRPADGEPVWRGLLRQAAGIKEWHAGLAGVLSDQGRADEAAAEYRRALELDPDYDIAQFGWAVALARQKRYREAADHYRAALRINPAYAEAWNNLGLALEDAREAEKCYRQAVGLRPEYTEARNNLALALTSQGRLEEAAAELREAIRRDPESEGSHRNLAATLGRAGAALLQSGDLTRAVDAYRGAVQAWPRSAEMHYNYGLVLARAGKLDAAIEEYREALRLNAGSAEIHNNLGTALARLGRFKEAAAHFQQAVKIRPEFSAARGNLDRARHQLGGR